MPPELLDHIHQLVNAVIHIPFPMLIIGLVAIFAAWLGLRS